MPKNKLVFLFLLSSLLAACDVSATPTGTPAPPPPTPTLTLAPIAPPTQPAGQLVDVGGFKLFIECQGQGSPAVILDGGIGVPSTSWSKVQPGVAEFTRVCRYDRAWLGGSQPGPLPRTSEQIVRELHTLLANAPVQGPYVLAGQSFGGLCAQLYSSTYPDEVAGLVFVDSTHADLDKRIEALLTPTRASAAPRRTGSERGENLLQGNLAE